MSSSIVMPEKVCSVTTTCKSDTNQPIAHMIQPPEFISNDVSIASSRIVRLFQDTARRFEVGLNLPIFLENDCRLIAPHILPDELKLMMKYKPVLEQAISNISIYTSCSENRSGLRQNNSRSSKQSEGTSTEAVDKKFDRDILRIIDIFFAKPCLLQLLDLGRLSTAALLFLDHFHAFQMTISNRLTISGETEQERNLKLRSVWWQNEKAKEKILRLTEKLHEHKELAEAAVAARNQTIHNQHLKIAKMLSESKDAIKNNVVESQRAMVAACKAAEIRHETLTQELADAKHLLYNDLQEHLASEKRLRAKRYKVESQLISWIDKYDLDMGEKQGELEELQRGFDDEEDQLKKLQEEFDIQEVEYNELMEEKEAIYIAERNEKMYIFILNRSARRIQRWWRAYLARKLARKLARRAKKGKKGKKGVGGGGGGAKKGGGKKKKKK